MPAYKRYRTHHHLRPKRHRQARRDAMLSSIQSAIAKTFNLPRRSIKLVLPGGRKARSTAGVRSLRKAWGE